MADTEWVQGRAGPVWRSIGSRRLVRRPSRCVGAHGRGYLRADNHCPISRGSGRGPARRLATRRRLLIWPVARLRDDPGHVTPPPGSVRPTAYPSRTVDGVYPAIYDRGRARVGIGPLVGVVVATGASTPCFWMSATPTRVGRRAPQSPRSRAAVTLCGDSSEGAAAFLLGQSAKPRSKPAAGLTMRRAGATNLLTGLWDAKVLPRVPYRRLDRPG